MIQVRDLGTSSSSEASSSSGSVTESEALSSFSPIKYTPPRQIVLLFMPSNFPNIKTILGFGLHRSISTRQQMRPANVHSLSLRISPKGGALATGNSLVSDHGPPPSGRNWELQHPASPSGGTSRPVHVSGFRDNLEV